MTTATFQPRICSHMTTEHTPTGSAAPELTGRLTDLASELAVAFDGAYLSFILQAELEDAFDTALLRDALADTPTVSGSWPIWNV